MNNVEIGNYISKCRKEKGITQQQLADILCVSNKAVSKWETSQGLPDTSILAALARALDTTVDSILNGEASDQQNPESTYSNLKGEEGSHSKAESSNTHNYSNNYSNNTTDRTIRSSDDETTKFLVNKSIYRFKFLSIFSIFLSLIGDIAFIGVLNEGETGAAFGIGIWFNLISFAIFFYYYNVTQKEVEIYNVTALNKIEFTNLRSLFFKPYLYFWILIPFLLLLYLLSCII